MKRLAALTAFVLVAMVAAVAPPGTPTQAQANCFTQTGFCITNPQFAEYFRTRGDVRILGYPISRSFTLEGFEVQFFQRVVLQLQGTTVSRLNLLDPTVMPMTRVNQSTFPPSDPAIAAQAPQTTSPTYAADVVEYIRKVSPDTFNGQPVKFFGTFNGTVPPDLAFAGQTPNPALLTLLNLEIWGLPTSNPAADPANGGFIYQRYQRGIMHYDASCGCTQGILVGEYLKSVITGKNLPSDLAQDMASSRYNGQYNPANAGWINRPGELPSTDLTGAFETGTGAVTPGSGAGQAATSVPVAGTATPTATLGALGPTVTIQVDDENIDPGQSVSITVIARYPTTIKWIEWDGIESENNNENDNDAATDGELSRKRFDCDNTECANVWTVKPTVGGRYTLRARAEGNDGVRSEWVTTTFRVREGNATTTPTATGAATATATTSAATSTAAATATATTAATATATATKAP